MLDVLSLLAMPVLFATAVAYVYGCERLKVRRP